MSTTVKELIKLLSNYNQDSIVVNHENEEFVHLISLDGNRTKISVKPKIGECNECGSSVHQTEVIDYPAVCTNCDENKYEFEITRTKEK